MNGETEVMRLLGMYDRPYFRVMMEVSGRGIYLKDEAGSLIPYAIVAENEQFRFQWPFKERAKTVRTSHSHSFLSVAVF